MSEEIASQWNSNRESEISTWTKQRMTNAQALATSIEISALWKFEVNMLSDWSKS